MNSKSLSILAAYILIFSTAAARIRQIKPSPENKFDISGSFENFAFGDTITLLIWDHVTNERKMNVIPHRELKYISNNGRFSFSVRNIYTATYFTLAHGKRDETFGNLIPFLKMFIAEPGDNVLVKIGKDNIGFSGKGSSKYQCKYACDRREIELREYVKTHPEITSEMNDSLKYFKYMCQYGGEWRFELSAKLGILNSYKAKLSSLAYNIFKTDITASYLVDWYEYCFSNYQYFIPGGSFYPIGGLSKDARERAMNEILNAARSNDYVFAKQNLPAPVLNISKDYLRYLYVRLSMQRYYFSEINSVYTIIKSQFKGTLRDRMLVFFFSEKQENLDQKDSLFRNALSIVKTKYCREQLLDIYEKQKKGTPAFNFSLADTSGRIVRLSDFKGKVVLMDFWFVGCGACLNYFKNQLSMVEEDFKYNPEMVFITVCIDKNRERWIKEGIASGAYTSPSAVNLYTGGKGIDDPIIKNYHITSYPFQLLIDRSGRIFSSSQNNLRLKNDRLAKTIDEALSAKDKASPF